MPQIDLVQGENLRRSWSFKKEGVAVDIRGMLIRFCARNTTSSAVLVQASTEPIGSDEDAYITIEDDDNGRADMDVPKSVTSEMPDKAIRAIFDVKITFADPLESDVTITELVEAGVFNYRGSTIKD